LNDTLELTSMTYVLGENGVNQQFNTSLDSLSATFLKDKNIAQECGEQIV